MLYVAQSVFPLDFDLVRTQSRDFPNSVRIFFCLSLSFSTSFLSFTVLSPTYSLLPPFTVCCFLSFCFYERLKHYFSFLHYFHQELINDIFTFLFVDILSLDQRSSDLVFPLQTLSLGHSEHKDKNTNGVNDQSSFADASPLEEQLIGSPLKPATDPGKGETFSISFMFTVLGAIF